MRTKKILTRNDYFEYWVKVNREMVYPRLPETGTDEEMQRELVIEIVHILKRLGGDYLPYGY